MYRDTQQHSQRIFRSSEEFPTKQTRKLPKRFKKQRKWGSEDTKITLTDKQVVKTCYVPTKVCDLEHMPEYLICRAQLVVVNQNQR